LRGFQTKEMLSDEAVLESRGRYGAMKIRRIHNQTKNRLTENLFRRISGIFLV